MEKIYLDHAATTPLLPEVIEEMKKTMELSFGNPSSQHYFGRQARQQIEKSRIIIANKLEAKPSEIIFTSGGTESNNTVFNSVKDLHKNDPKHIITSSIEHPSILEICLKLETDGWDITYLPVKENGIICLNTLKKSLKPTTVLVSIIAVSHETGTIQPLKEVSSLLQDHQALLHFDAVQALGKIALSVKEIPFNFLTASAHKIGGPKGVGILYIKSQTPFKKQFIGGLQENGLRAGTEDIVSIAGFGKAVSLVNNSKYQQIKENMKFWRNIILTSLHDVPHWNSSLEEHAVHSILNISFPQLHIDTLISMLDMQGIATSNGTACRSGTHEPSYVLKSMYGVSNFAKITNSIRISFGLSNTTEEIKYAAKIIAQSVKQLQKKT